MRILTMLLICLCICACSTTSNLCPAPDGQASVICSLSGQMNTSPEAISTTLQVANVMALEKSLYKAQEAEEFIDNIIQDLKNIKGKSITYAEALDYINDKFKVLSPEIQAVFIIVDPAGLATKEIKIPLSDYDINLLIKHLEKQKQIVQVYM